MYIIGAYIKLQADDVVIKKRYLILMFVGLVAVSTVFSYYFEGVAWEYCNPIVIAMAVIIFLIFKQMNIRNMKWINHFSKASFTCFLFHGLLISKIGIEQFCTKSPAVLICHLCVSVITIYFISWIIFICYDFVASRFFESFPKQNLVWCFDSDN